jgi:hypothetical protein
MTREHAGSARVSSPHSATLVPAAARFLRAEQNLFAPISTHSDSDGAIEGAAVCPTEVGAAVTGELVGVATSTYSDTVMLYGQKSEPHCLSFHLNAPLGHHAPLKPNAAMFQLSWS